MSGSGHSLNIRLTEAVVFLRGAVDLTSTKWHSVPNAPPALLRGLLVFQVDKPVKVKSIEVELEGRTRTEWPEGIGARRIDITEERLIMSAKTVFFQASSSARRNVSLGPGVTLEGSVGRDYRVSSETTHDDGDNSDSDEQAQHNSDTYSPPARPHSLDHAYSRHHRYPPVSHVEPRVVTSPTSDEEHEPVAMTPLITSVTASPVMSPVLELDGASEDVHSSNARRRSGYFVLDEPRPSISSWESSGQHLPLRMHPERSTSGVRANEEPPAYSLPAEQPVATAHRQSISTSRSRRSPTPTRSSSGISSTDADSARPPASRRFSVSRMMSWKGGRQDGERTSRRSSVEITRTSRPSVRPVQDTTVRGRSREKASRWTKLASTFKLDPKGKGKDRDGDPSHNGWQEFKKGTYTYPISFAIPANTPPTVHCQWGAVTYRLKAYVHRQGAFTPKISAVREVVLVAAPGDEELGDVTDTVGSSLGVGTHLHIERQWETQMRYLIVVGGRGAPIGGKLPIWMTLMPLAPIRIYRISFILEERVDYYAHRRQIVRHDPIRRWDLLSLKYEDKRLLPVDLEHYDRPLDALSASPLFPYVCLDPYASAGTASGGKNTPLHEHRDDALVNMLTADGPWMLHAELAIPKPCGWIHFTDRHPKSSLACHHLLKIIIRTERGDDVEVDPKTGRKKQFDIVVQTPIHILSCRCNNDWTSLPTYSRTMPSEEPGPLECNCTRKLGLSETLSSTPVASSSRMAYSAPSYATAAAAYAPLGLARAGAGAAHFFQHAVADLHGSSPHIEGAGGPAPGDALSEHSRKFERLMAGLESPAGDEPPRYQ